LITKGCALEVQGWIAVALEARSFKSVSEYATISAKNSTEHTANTIRQYASFVIAGIKKYGSADKMLTAYDAVYSYRSISDLRRFVAGSGQRATTSKRFSANKVATTLKAKYSVAEIKAIKALL
tara:strand:- start:913 stop:1284 length:372 start_codon:yes stop_codon:yes gene_type:complete